MPPNKIMDSFESWYGALRPMKQYGGQPAKGTIAAALIVLERLRGNCDLSIEAHLAEGEAQIAGLSLSSLRKILQRFDETREFPSEGGRTNRGNNKPVRQLLDRLKQSGLGDLPDQKRSDCIDEMQRFLVESLDAYYKLERIRFDFDAAKPARGLIGDILSKAQDRNQGGPMAQHLIGAKLAIRFPHIQIGNFTYSAADEQSGRSGDFRVGKTVFHVTIAPTMGHIARCAKNIQDGLGVFLIVNDTKLTTAKALLGTKGLEEKVAVESVESFVGQNISELAEFAPDKFSEKLAELLREYNRRASAVETDRSLLIEIPASIGGDEG